MATRRGGTGTCWKRTQKPGFPVGIDICSIWYGYDTKEAGRSDSETLATGGYRMKKPGKLYARNWPRAIGKLESSPKPHLQAPAGRNHDPVHWSRMGVAQTDACPSHLGDPPYDFR